MSGFVPPPYPHDRLRPLVEIAAEHDGGVVDLSIGSPFDAPPAFVLEPLADPIAARGYPSATGSDEYRDAVLGWLDRRFGVDLPRDAVAACVGTKEFVAGVPQWLRLRRPERDTVLYPAVSYPTYSMGATLAGCRAVPVPVDGNWRIDLDAVDPADVDRALCLWVNTPANPTGALDDLEAVAHWGRRHGVPVLSDECYAEFTWDGPPRSILEHGSDGVLAVHSLSKRSNLAGARIGFYAGDADLVGYLSEIRKHAGLMPPGPVQTAGALAWSDDDHVIRQRERYRHRLDLVATAVEEFGLAVPRPAGAFYLWVAAPDSDAWALTERFASELGVIVSPGEFYGLDATGYVRIAAVQPDERIDLVRERARARR